MSCTLYLCVCRASATSLLWLLVVVVVASSCLQLCSAQTAYLIPSLEQDVPSNSSYARLGNIMFNPAVLHQYDVIVLTADYRLQVRDSGVHRSRADPWERVCVCACVRCCQAENVLPFTFLAAAAAHASYILVTLDAHHAVLQPQLYSQNEPIALTRNLTIVSANFSTHGYRLLEVRCAVCRHSFAPHTCPVQRQSIGPQAAMLTDKQQIST